jgi:hypothetical protein
VNLAALVFDIAVRLLRGEVLELEDEDGRRWRADARSLHLVLPGSRESGVVLEGTAADIALEIVRRTGPGI